MVYSVDVTTNSKMGSLWILLNILTLFKSEFVQAQLSDLGLQPGNTGSLTPGDAISFGGFNMPDAVATSIDSSGPLLDVGQNSAGFSDSNQNMGFTQEPLVGAAAMGSSGSDLMPVSNSGMATFEISNSNTASETMNSATNQGFLNTALQIDGTNSGVVDTSANKLPINSPSLSIEGAAENTASLATDASNAASVDSGVNVGSERVMFFPQDSIIAANTGTVDTVGTNIANSDTLSQGQPRDMAGNQQVSNAMSDAISIGGQSSVNSLTKTGGNYPQSQSVASNPGISTGNNANANINFDFSSISSGKVTNTVSSTRNTMTQTKTNIGTQGASFDSSLFGPNNPQNPVVRQDLKGTVVLKQFMPLGQMPQDRSPSQVVEALKTSLMLKDVNIPSDNTQTGNQNNAIALQSSGGSIQPPGSSDSNINVMGSQGGMNPPPVNPVNKQDIWQAQNQCSIVFKRPHRYDERYFEELVHNKWLKRRCPPGTIYEPMNCVCATSDVVSLKKGCNPDLWMDFTYGIQDISGNDFVTNQQFSSGIQTYMGAMCLNGQSKLRVWRYHSFDFKDELYIRVRFKVDPLRLHSYPVITNCDKGEIEPSIGIVVKNHPDLAYIFVETINGLATVKLPIKVSEWNTATLKYNGHYLAGTVNEHKGVNATRYAKGEIRKNGESLMIGFCRRYGYLTGCIDDVTVYHCIPPGV